MFKAICVLVIAVMLLLLIYAFLDLIEEDDKK